MKDSNGEATGAGRRVVDELRTGGRLALFATGGRLVERERVADVLLLDARDVVERDELEREEERDDDGVPCERVPRCEPSELLMAFQPLRLSFDRTHQVEIQYEQQRRSQPCPLLLPLLLLPLLEFQPCVFQGLEPAP
jgi:hypothetical protein